jgi:chaperonin GroES
MKNKTGIRPILDRILVKPIQEAKVREGLAIPDETIARPQEGKVIAVGPGPRDSEGKPQEMDIVVGDVVLYGKFAGTDVRHKGENYLILNENDVLGVVNS